VTPGIPLIYNGQEVGLQKQLAFFEKDAIDWSANKDAATWTAFYAKFVKLRKANPALHSGLAGGNLNFFDNQPDKLLAFSRSKAKDNVVFLANTSARAIKTKLPISKTLAGKYIDYATGKTVSLAAGKALAITVKPWDFVIYSTNAAK
jgi:glycosidase